MVLNSDANRLQCVGRAKRLVVSTGDGGPGGPGWQPGQNNGDRESDRFILVAEP